MIELLPRPKKFLLHTPETFFNAAEAAGSCRTGDATLFVSPEITAFFGAPPVPAPELGFYFGAGETRTVDHRFREIDEYILDITSDSLELRSGSRGGLAAGLSTLRQLIRQTEGELPSLHIHDYADFEMRGVMLCNHIVHDHMPMIAPNAEALGLYLESMFDSKLNTLLLEYETTYPWRNHPKLSSRAAYTRAELAALQERCRARNIEIIPLVQSLGHVYYALIHDEYRHCSENLDHPQQFCPLKEETFELVKEQIDDLIESHPGIRYLHIGGDECRQLGVCPDCAAFVAKDGKYRLWAKYHKRVADYVESRGVKPILWHDIAIHQPEVLSDFGTGTRFHFWNYGDFSHGDMTSQLPLVQQQIDIGRVIGGPAARAESVHGSLHSPWGLRDLNIRKMAQTIYQAGGNQSIMTDWPDSGMPFGSAFPQHLAQGEATWNAEIPIPTEEYNRAFARCRYGCDVPYFPMLLWPLDRALPFAKGFGARLKHHLNRYEYKVKDAEAELAEFEKHLLHSDFEGYGDFFALGNRREGCENLLAILERMIGKAKSHSFELRSFRFTTLATLAFLHLVLGAAGARAIDKKRFFAHYLVAPEPVQRDLLEYPALVEAARNAYYAAYAPFVREELMERHFAELFPEQWQVLADCCSREL